MLKMSYTVHNFKTKKALKEAVANYLAYPFEEVKAVRCYNPGVGPDLSNHTGIVYLEGPHYPQPHKWYAQGEMVDGILVKVQ
jgi:hypothetical protein